MAFEQRGNKRYYYKKVRQGGKVRSIYLGREAVVGPALARQQAEKQADLERRLAFERETAELGQPLDQAYAALSALLNDVLLVAGFRKHKGQWRLHYDPHCPLILGPDFEIAQGHFLQPAAHTAESAALRQSLIQQGNWHQKGDLTEKGRRSFLEKFDAATAESVMLCLEEMRAALGYDEAPQLEQLVIDQVLTCWLQMELAQYVVGSTVSHMGDRPISGDTLKALDARLASAQRRYVTSINLLLSMRRHVALYSEAVFRSASSITLAVPKQLQAPAIIAGPAASNGHDSSPNPPSPFN